MTQKKSVNVLAIDGGGIKGLYSAKILATLEKHYSTKISDCFDLICGTSTGGLIALALSTGKSAEDIVQIYKDKAHIIFPQNNLLGKIKQIIWQGKHPNEGLKEVLNDIFGNQKLKDAKTNLCIPTINLNNCKPWVFKTPHCPSYTRDPETLMKEVALATTAAPTFFPIAKIDSFNNEFIDGGLWANNPSLVGITEVLKCFIKENSDYNSFNLLSLASVEENVSKLITKSADSSYASWDVGKNLISTFMQVQNKSIDNLSKHLCDNLPLAPKAHYIRISSPDLSIEQAKSIKIDSTDKNILKTLETLGEAKAYEYCNPNNTDLSLFFTQVTQEKAGGKTIV